MANPSQASRVFDLEILLLEPPWRYDVNDGPTWPSKYPELLPLLPFVYLAWADGDLSPDEIDALRGRMDRLAWLDPHAARHLRGWLDPAKPPAPAALLSLRDRIRAAAPAEGKGEAPAGGGALVRLGLEVLSAAARSADGPWSTPAAREALAELEAALHLPPDEARRAVLGRVADQRAPRATPALDPAPLMRLLEPDSDGIRARIMELLSTEEFNFGPEIPRAEHRAGVLGALGRLAEEGIGALAYPEHLGGRGRPDLTVAAIEALAYGDLSVMVKFGVQFGLFGGSVLQLGTTRHHEEYLPRIGSLELPGCYAMTERGHGSNVRDIETVARYDAEGGCFVVDSPTPSATKDWIGNAALHGRLATVFAQLEVDGVGHGVHAFLVPIRDAGGDPMPGIEIEDCGPKEGLNGVDNGRIRFSEVRIPRTALLNRFGEVGPDGEYRSPIPSAGRRFFTMLGTLVGGRVSIAAASVSVAKTALTIAIRYGARRRQFGPEGAEETPLLEYRAHQRLLLPRLARTYALHFAVREMTERYAALHRRTDDDASPEDTELARRELEVVAAALKSEASRHALDTLQAAREACGGRGYDALNRFGRLKGDADVFTTFEGANTVLLQLVAKGLLSRYRGEMTGLHFGGWVRLLAEMARTRVVELNPVVVRKTDEDHLVDPDFHADALEYREQRLLASAARRLKAMIDGGVDSFEALNAVQDHLLTLANAHADRLGWDSLHRAVESARDTPPHAVLSRLRALHGLALIEQSRAWYLEAGYIEGGKSRAIRAQVNRLCEEVAECAPGLVDAFGIPDEVLRAPDGLSGAGR